MKKIIISIAILLMATTAFAKRPTGLNLGAGFANNFTALDNDAQSFFGGYAEIGYNAMFSDMSGLYVGGRWSAVYNNKYGSVPGVAVDYHHSLHYLEIPVKYAFQTGGKTKFFFDLGPTVNFWLFARTRVEGSTAGATLIKSGSWFDADIFNRVNLSLGGNIGVKFGHAKVYAGYDQGLFSMTKKDYCFSNIGQLRVGFAWVW